MPLLAAGRVQLSQAVGTCREQHPEPRCIGQRCNLRCFMQCQHTSGLGSPGISGLAPAGTAMDAGSSCGAPRVALPGRHGRAPYATAARPRLRPMQEAPQPWSPPPRRTARPPARRQEGGRCWLKSRAAPRLDAARQARAGARRCCGFPLALGRLRARGGVVPVIERGVIRRGVPPHSPKTSSLLSLRLTRGLFTGQPKLATITLCFLLRFGMPQVATDFYSRSLWARLGRWRNGPHDG